MRLHPSPRARLVGLGALLAFGILPVWAVPQEKKPADSPAVSAASTAEPYLFQPSGTNLPTTLPRWWTAKVSPDGKTLAVAAGNTSERGEIWLYDFPSGKFRSIIEHKAGVRQIAFSPDSRTLAAGGFDNTLSLYDLKSRKLTATGVGHTGGINSVAFTSDGQRLVTGGLDNTIRVWWTPATAIPADQQPVPTFSPFAILQGHTNWVLSIAVSKDGRTIVSGSRDNSARLWDMPEPGKVTWKVFEIDKTISAVRNPNQPMVVTTPRKVLAGHANAIEAVTISDDGKTVVTGSWDMTAKSWNAATGQVVKTFQGHKAGVWSVAISPDGKTLATAAGMTAAGPPQPPRQLPQQFAVAPPIAASAPPAPPPPVSEVRTWNLADAKLLAEHPRHDRGVSSVVFSPNGKKLVSTAEDGSARVIALDEKIDPILLRRAADAPQQIVLTLAISPDGKLLAAGGDAKYISLWDLEKKQFRGAWLAHDDVVSTLAFSPDGKTLVSGSYDRMLKFWSIDQWRPSEASPSVKKVAGHMNWIFSVAFSRDGKVLASGGYDRVIRLWDLSNWKENWFTDSPPARLLKGHTAGVRSLAFTADGSRLASAGADRTLRLWRLSDGEQIAIARGHKGALRAVAIGPDGNTFATGSEDRSVKLWQFQEGMEGLEAKEIHTFENLGDMIAELAFSPRGLSLVVGLWNGQIQLLDPALGKRRINMPGHADSVTALSFTRDGKTLVSGSYDRTVRVWGPQPPPPPPLLTYAGHKDAVHSIALSPDGRWTATGSRDGRLRIYDRQSGLEKVNIAAHAGGVHRVAFSPDSKLLATAGADKIVRIRKLDGQPLVEFAGHTDEVLHVVFSSNGKLLATAGKDMTVRVWRTDWRPGMRSVKTFGFELNGPLVTALAGHTGAVSALGFSPDDKFLASAGADRNFRLWDATTWKLKSEIPGSATNGEFAALAFSPDGKTIALAHNQDQMIGPCGDLLQQQFRNVLMVDVVTGKPKGPGNLGFAHGDWVTDLAWSSDGQTLLTTSRDMNVRLWNVAGNRIIRQFKAHEASIAAMALDPEEELVATAGDDRAARLWSVSMQQVVARAMVTGHAGQIWFAEMSKDGKYLVTGGDDKIVRLRTALPGSEPFKITGSFQAVYSVTASPDGKWLASGHGDGVVRILDATNGKQVKQIAADKFRVWGLAFTHDSKRLVSVTGDWDNQTQPGTVKLWDVAGGKMIRQFSGPTGTVFAVAISPDCKTLAAGGHDQTIRLWDLESGALKHSLKGHPGIVRTIAFSIDGLTLVAGSHRDSTLVFWNTATGAEKSRLIMPDGMFVNRVLYMPNGKRLAIAGNVKPQFVKFANEAQQRAFRPQMQEVGRIILWDLEKNQAVYQMHGHTGMALDLSIHPGENILCSVGGAFNGEAEVNFWNVNGGFRMGRLQGHSRWCEAGTFLPDGRLLTGAGTVNAPGELKVWNTDGIAVAKGFDAHAKFATCADFHPDGTWLATGSGDHTVILWDFANYLKTGFVAKRVLIGHNDQIRRVKFSPDGSILASSAENGTVILWDPKTGERIRMIQAAPDKAVYSIAFSPNGKRLVTGAGKYQTQQPGEAKIWDVNSGKLLAELKGHTREVWTVAFSPNGKWIVTGAGDRNIRVFDAQALQLAKTLTTPTGLRNICFSPDGRTLASCGGADNDAVVRLWDAESWRERLTLSGHGAMIFQVRFTPDGKTLLSASKDGSVRVWDLPQKKPLRTAMGK